jgi:hypothetical protein|tara:strand:+ start:394 stop:678 length:285 start_codon:yes stop_codon:yes gene_type:complete
MKERNTSNWDTRDFQDWVVRNIHLLLSGKQLELFMKNNFGYTDLKLFGKIKEAENLKNVYQESIMDKVFYQHTVSPKKIQELVGEDYKWVSINY